MSGRELTDIIAGLDDVSNPDGTEKLLARKSDGTLVAIEPSSIGTPTVKDTPGNVVDCTSAIQAEIDANISAGIKPTRLLEGHHKITGSVYLDPPDNLRVSSTTTKFQFSLRLEGSGIGSATVPSGAVLRPTFNDDVALWVGSGQGMEVKGLGIWGPDTLATGGGGVAVAGGDGGSSLFKAEDVYVRTMDTAFEVGRNSDGLGDSNLFLRCVADNCRVGFQFSRSQNYINDLIACRSNSKIGVFVNQGKVINWTGGNISRPGSQHKKYTVTGGSLSRIARSFLGSSYHNYSWPVVVSGADSDLTSGVHDCFAVETTSFGVVPLLLINDERVNRDGSSNIDPTQPWDSGTNTLTLVINPYWLSQNYDLENDITSLTSLSSELAAATSLYAVDQTVSFVGTGINARDFHLENASTVTSLLRTSTAFQGAYGAVINGCYVNYDPAFTGSQLSTGDTRAIFLNQQVHGFIELRQTEARLDNIHVSANGGYANNGLCLDVAGALRMTVGDLHNTMAAPNVRVWSGNDRVEGALHNSIMLGGGIWEDGSPFLARGLSTQDDDYKWHVYGPGRVRFVGHQPDPAALLRISPAQYAVVSGTLPDIGTYVPIYGRRTYVIDHWDNSGGAPVLVRSNHEFLSYGQDIAATWSHKGASTCVYMDATALGWMRAGLKLRPKNAAGRTAWYVVTGVYAIPSGSFGGYVSVCRIGSGGEIWLEGDKDTTFTGTVLEGEAYSFS